MYRTALLINRFIYLPNQPKTACTKAKSMFFLKNISRVVCTKYLLDTEQNINYYSLILYLL